MTHLDQQQSADRAEGDVSRRSMLRGVAIGGLALPVLAACGSNDSPSAAEDSSSESSSDSGSDSGSDPSSDSSGSGSSGGATVAVADVPVGGGTVLAAEKVVVTQPKKGEFKAFDATCTHKGCPVKSVEDGEIVCPCHGSHFSIADGSPTHGPAEKPLGAKTATVSGGQVTVS